MFGCAASTAIAGSFCLFCENGDGGLPAVTFVSGLNASAAPTSTVIASTSAPATMTARRLTRLILLIFPLSVPRRYRATRLPRFAGLGRLQDGRRPACAQILP